jgi:hypothetical protein
MAIKIQKTSEVPFNGVKCIVFGGAGVGKTRFCATAPRPILISAESGLLSLGDVDCDFIEIKTLKDLNAAYEALKESKDYDTICLDSLSEIAEVLITEIKPNYKDPRQAYAELAESMMVMLKKFRDVKGKNTIFTCKMIAIKDEESGAVTNELLIPGKVLGYQIPYLVDELFYLGVDRKGEQELYTSPTRKQFSKDRSGALEAIEKPQSGKTEINATDIINRIEDRLKNKKT